MNKASLDFLKKLLETPSPTGFEAPVQQVVKRYMKPYADTIEGDVHGNLIVGLNTKAERRVMIAGHCDQIGFMVRYIDAQGFVYIDPLGGIDGGVLPGSIVTIHSEKGAVKGVFGRKPIHAQKPEERAQMKIDLEAAWIDIGAKDRKDAQRMIAIGDPITFELNVLEMANQFISAPGLDNKVGLFVAMEALRLCAKSKLNVALYSVSTVQEEVGLRGAKTAAYRIDPEVAIAVDVTFSSDNPGTSSSRATPCELGKGPGIYKGPNVNPTLEKLLLQAGKKAKIPTQVLPYGRLLGNDANVMQVSRSGTAAASIGIPNRYMHTQCEVCNLKDLENAAKLIAECVKGLGKRSNFTLK